MEPGSAAARITHTWCTICLRHIGICFRRSITRTSASKPLEIIGGTGVNPQSVVRHLFFQILGSGAPWMPRGSPSWVRSRTSFSINHDSRIFNSFSWVSLHGTRFGCRTHHSHVVHPLPEAYRHMLRAFHYADECFQA